MSSQISIHVFLWGELAEITGNNSVKLTGNTVEALIRHFSVLYPQAAGKVWSVAINGKTASSSQTIKSGDSITFLPPFSGG